MFLNDFIKELKLHCQFLEQEGYTYQNVDTSIDRNISYDRELGTDSLRISFGWTQYGDEYHVSGIQGLKRFGIIECEIEKVMVGKYKYFTVYTSPSVDLIPEGLLFESNGNNISFILKTYNDILLFCEYIKVFFYKSALGFFLMYSDVQDVSKQLKSLLDSKKLQSLLTSANNTTILRFYTIARISNNDEILDFFKTKYMPHLEDNIGNNLKKLEKERLSFIIRNIAR